MALSEAYEVEDGPFKYQPLRGPMFTRILVLEPADSQFDIVQCQFDEINLEHTMPAYIIHEPVLPEDPQPGHVILCEGRLLHISEHTYFFLCNMRSQKDPRMRRVWSPRLSINTGDEVEVTAQKELLPLILRRAAQRISLSASYKHERLQFRAIRVLELDSTGQHNGLLTTRMRHIELDKNPEYYYLDIREGLTTSSWPDKKPIICNNRLLTVPTPLHQVLCSILPRGPRAFFIHALCVDFENVDDVSYHEDICKVIRKMAKECIGIQQPQYVYGPLPQDRPHIRLLKLLPASESTEVVVADIGHFPLDACPEYVALSYVWGSPNPPWMVCTRDGRYIVCTQSLRVALCHLRERGDLIVWADAVCINQRDNDEKSKQVLLMGDIYRRASRVIVELGINCDDDKHRVCRVFPPILINMLSLTSQVLRAVRPERPSISPNEYSKFGIPSYGHKAWGAWRSMRSRPWFTRSWIVQEVAAGKDVTVLYNGRSYKWDKMAMANRVTANEQVDLDTYNGKMNMTNLSELQTMGKANAPKLLSLLITFRNLDATDPRDKIYAFRGLAADGDSSPLPNYSQAVEEVFLDYATFFVKQGFGAQLLSEAGLSRSNKSLPSWVPDWSFSVSWQTFNYSKAQTWVSLEIMDASIAASNSNATIRGNQPGILNAQGCVVDRIFGVSTPVSNTYVYGEHQNRPRIDKEVWELYHSALKLALDNKERDQQKSQALLQLTLLGGTKSSFKPLHGFYQRSKALGDRPAGPENAAAVETFDSELRERLSSRRFCTTSGGNMGIVAAMADVGDEVAWLKGVDAPMIFRRNGQADHVLIGDAFMMDCTGDEQPLQRPDDSNFEEIQIA
ncbi:hypothetical protein S40288_05485 [Stachybotrys chartarum IBT 40288]|nr:hypothetical protein S40288_05485 [Stachybotrys chartarum IBT 40288]